jgi:hypothetical protein
MVVPFSFLETAAQSNGERRVIHLYGSMEKPENRSIQVLFRDLLLP